MPPFKRTLCGLAVLMVSLPASALAATTAPPPSTSLPSSEGAGSTPRKKTQTRASKHALLVSRQLWATIDVCNPPDQPYTVGIRGSMPGDGLARDRMYMSFRLQYLDATSKQWVDLVSGATPDYIAVGNSESARQDGRSFQLVPGKTSSTLRGVVDFQWRQGKKVLASAALPTTAGRRSIAGADPANFSAATCLIG